MKNKIILPFLVLLIASCTDLSEDLYDKLPADQFPENEIQANVQSAVVYSFMREFIDNGGWWFAQEVTSDEMTCPTRHTDWDDGGKWRVLHQHTWLPTTEAVESMWPRFYKGIGEANRLIEQLGGGELSPAGKSSLAQLKIMRAYYYYLLIDNYGDVPYETMFSNAVKKPYRAYREVVFDSVLTELTTSIPDLLASQSKTSVTKGMAFTLLAKLYLNAEVYTGQAMWKEAEEACDSVIALGQYSLDTDPLGPFKTENSKNTEHIFLIPYDEDTYKGFNLHMRTLHYISNATFDMVAGPWNGFCVMENHFKTYEEQDLRLNPAPNEGYFLVGQQYSSAGSTLFDETAKSNLIFDAHIPALKMDASYTLKEIRMSGVRVQKFEIASGAKENLSNDFPIFRYADVLLMKAEAMIRQGENGDEYVNMIRKRAGVPEWDNTTLTQILAERGRELFWEAHRRQDLIRFGQFNKAWWEKDASSPDRNTFPIPQSQVDANANLAADPR